MKFPPGVAFVSDATGKEIQARIPTVFGASTLKILGDAEVKYVSGEQFKLGDRDLLLMHEEDILAVIA